VNGQGTEERIGNLLILIFHLSCFSWHSAGERDDESSHVTASSLQLHTKLLKPESGFKMDTMIIDRQRGVGHRRGDGEHQSHQSGDSLSLKGLISKLCVFYQP
jgi:hypothetical protein